MFNAMPLSGSLWDKELNIIDCNQESANLFHLSDKDEFKEKFLMLSPEYQPGGEASGDKAREHVKRAFDEGFCRFEWMHLSATGEYIPCEVILVKVENRGEPIVAAYIRDLSELDKTLNAMYKAQDDLGLALEAAEDNAKAKSEFLDNMSHELRTPMNAILGFLRMAARTDLSVEQRNYITEAESSAKKLLRIIDDVLDFTEIKDKKMKLSSIEFKLSDVFEEIIEAFVPAARSKNLELNMRLPLNTPDLIVGDPDKLKRILSSLIDNAIKFTEKGKIMVRADIKQLTESRVELSVYVRDTGIGIMPDQMPSLFDPFWQADTSLTRKQGGTGFGLPLSKHLAVLLDGRLWAESEYEEGSTFYFTARFKLPGVSDAIAQAHEVITCLPEYTNTDKMPYAPDNSQLLVVDDVEVNRIIAEELLTCMGYHVDIASNGQEAIDMIDTKDYNAVLMDIQMPVMDGLTATKKIRENGKHNNLPIIALSAHSLPEDMEKGLAFGMNDYITKPIDNNTLCTTLRKWIAPRDKSSPQAYQASDAVEAIA